MLKDNRISFILFIVGIVFLAFIGGISAERYHFSPASLFSDGLESAEAWWQRLDLPENPTGQDDIEFAVAHSKVFLNSEHAYNGYTLMVARFSTSAFLLDMKGRVIHRWDMPLSKAWPHPTHIQPGKNEPLVYIEKAWLYPNGDLLAVFINSGDAPTGYGIVKMDKDSNVLWTYDEFAHHDVYVDQENGNLYTLIHKTAKKPIPGLEDLPPRVLEDFIVTLSPEGKELDRLSIAEAFRDSPFALMLYHVPKNAFSWDHFHTNAVSKLEPAMAAKFPLFKAGQILISMRNMNTVAVVDLKARKVVWAYNGLWRAQHGARFLDNGHILLLDNMGHVVKGAPRSRLVEINPSTLEVAWSYDGGKTPFYTEVYGRVQRLPNGNTLATDSMNRRAFEVTPDGYIVWDYQLPALYRKELEGTGRPMPVYCKNVCAEERLNTNADVSAIIVDAQRFAEDSLPFLAKSDIIMPKDHRNEK